MVAMLVEIRKPPYRRATRLGVNVASATAQEMETRPIKANKAKVEMIRQPSLP